jgi:hypothetical protein
LVFARVLCYFLGFYCKGNFDLSINLDTAMKETSAKRVFLVSVSITLLLHFVASGAGQAAESRPTSQVEWEKVLKAAEAEDEVVVYEEKIGVRELLLMALMKKYSDP